jgi:hypothetical protein
VRRCCAMDTTFSAGWRSSKHGKDQTTSNGDKWG